jgi:hypothetical protein
MQHARAPQHVRDTVVAIVSIRAVVHEPNSILMAIPNELLFEIFQYLPWVGSGADAPQEVY